MVAPLLVLVAHGLDLVTFGLVLPAYGAGGESNPIMGAVIAAAGIGGVVAVKAGGASLLALIVHRRHRYLLIAAGAGLLGVAANISALVLLT